jgi:hypothetical protein
VTGAVAGPSRLCWPEVRCVAGRRATVDQGGNAPPKVPNYRTSLTTAAHNKSVQRESPQVWYESPQDEGCRI